jgi:hypothetical protein
MTHPQTLLSHVLGGPTNSLEEQSDIDDRAACKHADDPLSFFPDD